MTSNLFADRYRIVKQVGEGGMGVVFEAKDELLKKTVAIKTIRKGYIQGDHVIRFQQEAKALATLNHPGLVPLYVFGLTEDNEPYMVMRFERGTTLADMIRGRGHLPLIRSLNIFIQIADAMQHAHSHGVLHRDLKPGNIMIRGPLDAPEVVVLDFGVAMIEAGDAIATLTKTGMIIGTPNYMSPEQVRGRDVDARSDIYALGCIMYETLTGKQPFSAATALELLSQKSTSEAPSINDAHGNNGSNSFPLGIAEIVATALATDANERYQSMQELKNDLLAFKGGDYKAAGSEGEIPVVSQVARADKSARLIIVAAGIFVIGLVFSFVFVAKVTDDPSSKPVSPSATTGSSAGSRSHESKVSEPLALWEYENAALTAYELPDEQSLKASLKKSFQRGPLKSVLVRDSSVTCECLADADLKEETAEIYEFTTNGCPVTEKGMAAIGKLPALKYLHVRGAALTAGGIAAVRDLDLDLLDIERATIDQHGLDEILNFKKLKYLYLALIPSVSDQYVQRLAESLKQLKGLSLQSSSAVTRKCLPSLKRLKNLTALNINMMKLEESDISILAEFPSLTSLEMRGNKGISAEALKKLAKLKNLQKLIIESQLAPEKLEEINRAFYPRKKVVEIHRAVDHTAATELIKDP